MDRRQFLAGSLATMVILPLTVSARGKGILANVVDVNALQFKPVRQLATSLTLNLVTGNLLNFGYQTLSGNQPNLYQNQVYLWEVSADAIPWSSTAIAAEPVLLNIPAGDQNFQNVEISTNAYILGYSLAPARAGPEWSAYSSVVASAYIPPGSGGLENRQVTQSACSIKPLYVGTSSLACYFTFLPGFNAQLSGSWIGLWPGSSASYTLPPKWSAPVAVAADSGNAGINGVAFSVGTTYTLGLFSGGYNAEPGKCDLRLLSCVAVFTT